MPTTYGAKYIDQYARVASAQVRMAEIERSITDLQDRAAEAQAVASSERANLIALEEALAVPPADLGEFSGILRDQNREAQDRRAAGAAVAAQNRLSATQRQALTTGDTAAKRRALNAAFQANSGMNQAQLKEAVALARQQGIYSPQELQSLEATIPDYPPAATLSGDGTGGGGVQSGERSRELALDALFLRDAASAYGGAQAQALMDARKQRATTSSRYATEADALDAYVSLLEDGDVTLDEWAAVGGYTDAAEAKADYDLARGIYNQAKSERSFRNDQRKYFESSWLMQARATADATAAAEAASSRVPSDPRREALRRELVARGIDPDEQYPQYRGTPMQGYATTADRIYGEVSGNVRPATATQTQIARYVDLARASSAGFKVEALEGQLRKMGLSPSDYHEAVGFALAYARSRTQAAAPPNQRELQDQADTQRKQQEEVAAQAELMAQQKAQAEKRRLDEMSQTLTLRARAGEDAAAYYGALRASGMDANAARSEMDRVYPEFGRPVPGGPIDLRGADREATRDISTRLDAAIQAGRPQLPPANTLTDDAVKKAFIERWMATNMPDQSIAPQPQPGANATPALRSDLAPPDPELDLARQMREKEERLRLRPEGSTIPKIPDPTNPSYAYQDALGGGYNVYKNGVQTGTALPGSREALSIQQVLSGGQPLPRPRPAAPPPAPTTTAPQVDTTSDFTSDFIRGADGRLIPNPNKR